ncbi:MAG TPA: EAL domain-containing protein [bacterium]|jgi:EAL domain-containing protein (putative c-di-GMP-specific phosphodiesterase class I)|nr:EAL domain-containing protein [bacterium]
MPTDFSTLIARDELLSFFQPMVSVKRKRCVAAQARVRLKAKDSDEALSPKDLFARAEKEGLSLDLDRHCRLMALTNFAQLNDRDPELLLLLKFHGSVLNQDGVHGSGWIIDEVRRLGLDPGSIVIEIDDSPVESVEVLKNFADRYRGHGFLIAVDNLNDGYFNIKRLAVLKPDFIRLGFSQVRGVDYDHVQREIVRSLTSLARRIGALVVADKLETESEVSACMELGVDLFMGSYFSDSLPFERWSVRTAEAPVEKAAALYQSRVARAEKAKELQALQHRALMLTLGQRLAHCQPEDFEYELRALNMKEEDIECLYVLNRAGWQITDTVALPSLRARTRGALFKPAPKGTDHSYKEYFIGLMEGGHVRHVTEPYISMASGNLCRTLSCHIKGANGRDYVLCLDASLDVPEPAARA